MKKLRILTDSMAHIPDALCQEYGITVVPLPYVWEGETLFDFDIGPREFYTRLRNSKRTPQTSGPPPGLFKEQFESLGKDGDPILAITVGEVFSSTFHAANLAKENTSTGEITVFSSDSNTMGLGFMVLAAARAAREGKELNEIIAILEHLKRSTGVIFATPHIEYLRRGGRISHLRSIIASTMNLIPIMEIQNSPIQVIERIRSQKKINTRLLELVAERLRNETPLRLAVVHADAEEKAWDLAKEVRNHFSADELITSELTPVLGIHTGPDAIGLAYSSGY